MPAFTPTIAGLPTSTPFVGPEAIVRKSGIPMRARIGANENAYGPSPKAIAAMREAIAGSWAYGDPEVHDLREAIARHHNVPPECVTVGEGIDGLFGLAVRMFIEPGTPVASSTGAYPTFNYHVLGFGGKLCTTPYVDDREDPESLLKLAAEVKARIIYFANPDNPMGTCWPAGVVQKLIDRVPEDAILMLDEAYQDFAPPGTVTDLDMSNRNVLRFRTFSKAYGMAGVRVGYALGHRDVIAPFDRIRDHFGISRISQAGALAALADQQYLAESIDRIKAGRERLYAIARANGLKPIQSATNFVAMDAGRDAAHARAIVDGLASHGVFIRMPGVAPLNRCIRVSVGTENDLDLLAEVLPVVLRDLS